MWWGRGEVGNYWLAKEDELEMEGSEESGPG